MSTFTTSAGSKRRPAGTRRLTTDLPAGLHGRLVAEHDATGAPHTEFIQSCVEQVRDEPKTLETVRRRCAERRPAARQEREARHGEERSPGNIKRLTSDLPNDLYMWLVAERAETGNPHTEFVRALLETVLDHPVRLRAVRRRTVDRRRRLYAPLIHRL